MPVPSSAAAVMLPVWLPSAVPVKPPVDGELLLDALRARKPVGAVAVIFGESSVYGAFAACKRAARLVLPVRAHAHFHR